MIGQHLIGKYVIVRTFSAGVHAGFLGERDGKEVVLTDTQRIWSWEGAFTLSEIAMMGLDEAKSKVSTPVLFNLLTEAIEVIQCSDRGQASIRRVKWVK